MIVSGPARAHTHTCMPWHIPTFYFLCPSSVLSLWVAQHPQIFTHCLLCCNQLEQSMMARKSVSSVVFVYSMLHHKLLVHLYCTAVVTALVAVVVTNFIAFRSNLKYIFSKSTTYRALKFPWSRIAAVSPLSYNSVGVALHCQALSVYCVSL